MVEAYSVLAQSAPGATSLTPIYTVPASTQVVVAFMNICNRSSSARTFRVAIQVAGASISNEHYVYYDHPIAANDTVNVLQGCTLEATDVVSVYVSAADISVNLFGAEVA